MKKLSIILSLLSLVILVNISRAAYAVTFFEAEWTLHTSGAGNKYISKAFDIEENVNSISFYFPDDMLYGPFLNYIDGVGVNPSNVKFYDANTQLIGTINFVDVVTTIIQGTWIDFIVPENATHVVVEVGVYADFEAPLLEPLNHAIGYDEGRAIYTIMYYADGVLFYTLQTSALFIGDRQPIYPQKEGFRVAAVTYADGSPFSVYIDPAKANASNQIFVIVNYERIIDVEPDPELEVNWLAKFFSDFGIDSRLGYILLSLAIFAGTIILFLILKINILLAGIINIVIASIFYYYGFIGLVEVLVVLIGFALIFLFRRAQDE